MTDKMFLLIKLHSLANTIDEYRFEMTEVIGGMASIKKKKSAYVLSTLNYL